MALPGLRAAIMELVHGALHGAPAEIGMMSHPAAIRDMVMAQPAPRSLTRDLLEIRGASALGDNADFFLRRRGSPDTVGRPEPLKARDDWANGAQTNRDFNPEHHFAVRVRDRDTLDPQYAFYLLQHLYNQRKPLFGQHAHGTLALQHLRLSDITKLYDAQIPPPPHGEPQRLMNVQMPNADQHGFAAMDLRRALQARLSGHSLWDEGE